MQENEYSHSQRVQRLSQFHPDAQASVVDFPEYHVPDEQSYPQTSLYVPAVCKDYMQLI